MATQRGRSVRTRVQKPSFSDSHSEPSRTSSSSSFGGISNRSSSSDFSFHEERGMGEEEEALELAFETILPWNPDSPLHLWENSRDMGAYLDALDAVLSFINKKSSTPGPGSGYGYGGFGSGSCSDSLEKARGAVSLAMQRVGAAFRHLLEIHSTPVEPDRVFFAAPEDDEDDCEATTPGEDAEEFRFTFPLIRAEPVVACLASIAERMLACGYKAECVRIYLDVRKPILEQSLCALGFEQIGAEELQRMPWDNLVLEMSKWLRLLRPLVRAVFGSELELCRQIIGDSSTAAATVADIAADPMLEMLRFGENVANSERSPERLFKILDMFDALQQVLPDIHSLFATHKDVKQVAERVSIMLGEAARAAFSAFETAVEQDVATNPAMGGIVHPMTRYVMNYLRLVGVYIETLTTLLTKTHQPQEQFDPNPNRNPASSLLSAQTTNLMDHLERNMVERSKLYKDPALSYIFLLNNTNYIVQKVRDSEVKALLGDDWIRENLRKLRQYNGHYRKAAWMSVLHCLRDEGIRTGGSFSSGVSKSILKDRFRKFNAAFQEVHQNQSTWIVSDEKLRNDIRISVEEFLLPAYQSFIGRFQSFLEGEKHIDRYIKYTPEDIQACLNDLFSGAPASTASHLSRRRSTGTF